MPISCWHANLLLIFGFSCAAGLAVEHNTDHTVEVLGTGALSESEHLDVSVVDAGNHAAPASTHPQLMRSAPANAASLASRPSVGVSCDDAITKAKNMVGAYKQMVIRDSNGTVSDRDLDVGNWVRYVEEKLHADPPEVGADVLNAFYQVLNRLTLSDGLINGNVWTISHAEALFGCFGFDGTLERHNATVTNRPLCGGDLVCQEVENEQYGGLLQGVPWIKYQWALSGNCTDNFTRYRSTGEETASNLGITPDVTTQSITGCHEVPFCIAGDVKKETESAFILATHRIRQQVPCISFKQIQWEGGDECVSVPSVIVQSKKGGCWSHAGQVSGRLPTYERKSQTINLGTGCAAVGLVLHQLCHTLGLLHEMYREDRDHFVHMQLHNAIPEKFFRGTFMSVREVAGGSGNKGFDFLSLMMYSSFTFSKNGAMVARPRDLRAKNFMGQRMGLSELDARLLGELYGCADQVVSLSGDKWLSEHLRAASEYGSSDGQVPSDENIAACEDTNSTGFFDQHDTEYACRALKPHCGHSSLGASMRTKCPLTCHACVPCMWPVTDDDACNYLWVPPPVKAADDSGTQRPMARLALLPLSLLSVYVVLT